MQAILRALQSGPWFLLDSRLERHSQAVQAIGTQANDVYYRLRPDPEGLELADDAIRSLSEFWGLPVDGHRIAVTREQIDELGLTDDFNPAKTTSSRFKKFVERTGGQKTWEVESLEPDYLVGQIKAAIEANMDMDLYERVVQQELRDCEELQTIRRQIAGELSL